MNKELEQLCEIRDYRPKDEAFIMTTFLRGVYYGNSWFSLIPKRIFMENYRKIAAALLQKPTTTVKVACLKEDPDVILGYSILSSNFTTVHFVFVKKPWRGLGLGRALTPALASQATHLTNLGRILLPKLESCVFNPFSI